MWKEGEDEVHHCVGSRYEYMISCKTENRGFGVKARKNIPKGTVIDVYFGEIIEEKEYDRRMKYAQNHNIDFYAMEYGINSLEKTLFIDASRKGSYARLVKQSCFDFNCEFVNYVSDGKNYKVLIPLRKIKKGEDLTVNYERYNRHGTFLRF